VALTIASREWTAVVVLDLNGRITLGEGSGAVARRHSRADRPGKKNVCSTWAR